MKKLLLTTSLFISVFSQAQLVLTQPFNEPVVGDTSKAYILDTTSFSSGLGVNSTGANHVWNYQALVNTTTLVSSAYVDPSAVPASTNYPGCTMVQKQGPLSSFMKSVTNPTTQTEFLGVNSPGLSMNFTNTAVMVRYPFTFGNTVTDPFSGSFTFSTTTGNATGNATTTADGTGTLNLPGGITYTNVLRVKSVQNINMTVSGFPAGSVKQTLYNFYHASEKFPVFSINYTSIALALQSPTVSASVTGHKNAFPVGLNENKNEMISATIYPNPANDIISIVIGGEQITPKEVKIFNQLGQEVKTLPYSEQLNIASLSSGIYFIEVLTDKGAVRKKLVKG